MPRPEQNNSDSSISIPLEDQSHKKLPYPQPLPQTSQSQPEEEDIISPDAVAAIAGLDSSDSEMDSESSGHRRRRSSLMNPLNANAQSSKSPRTRSPAKNGIIQEEPKVGELGDRLSVPDAGQPEDLSDDDDDLQYDEETGLTGKDKTRRKRKRRRNTLLDQRVVNNSAATTAEEKKQADQNVLRKGIINGVLIGLWYMFSLSISIVGFLPSHPYKTMLTPLVQQMDV